MPEFAFCPKCGSLKEEKKICRACTNIIRTKEKSVRIVKESERLLKPQQRKAEHYAKIQKQKEKERKKKHHVSIRYSDSLGIEWIFDPENIYSKKIVNFCVKCRKNKVHYAGWWVRACGQYAPDNAKRIFICSDCWKPKR